MRTWNKHNWKISVALVTLTSLLNCTTDAHACDCLPVSSSQEAIKSATLVFEGEVLEIKKFSIEKIKPGYDEFAVKFRRIKSWKGKDDDYFIIRTAVEKEHCGFEFQSGENYMVYAIGGPIPVVTRCTRTSLSSSQSAKNDIRVFGLN